MTSAHQVFLLVQRLLLSEGFAEEGKSDVGKLVKWPGMNQRLNHMQLR